MTHLFPFFGNNILKVPVSGFAFWGILLSFLIISVHAALAAEVKLIWDPPDSGEPDGYKIYYGNASETYVKDVYVGAPTNCTITGLEEGKTYYFAATAYYPDGSESGFSNEAVKYIPIAIADSDGDDLSDSDEINIYRTNPNEPDTDGDGYLDGEEVFDYHTSPLKSDTDGDGIPDGQDPFPNGTGKTEIILDNTDAGFSSGPAAWPKSSFSPGGYKEIYQYAGPNGGRSWARWTLTLPTSGECEVFARWTSASNRATSAPYTIVNDGNRISVAINQTVNGGQFISLGTHWLEAGTVEIVLTDAPAGYVVADAVMIAFDVGADSYEMGEVIIDNGGEGFTSSPSPWARSSFVSGYLGSDYQYADASATGKWAKWSFNVPISGVFEIHARWTAASNRSTSAIYEITDGTSEISAVVNQTANNGRFVSLGTRWLNAGEVTVTLKNGGSGCVVADAVKISPR